MAVQEFDKLNILKRRSIPYEEYFGDMELAPKQKKKRIELALILEDYIMLFFDLIQTETIDEAKIKQELTYSLYDTLADKDYFLNDSELDKYITNTVNTTYQNTVDNLANYPDQIDYTESGPYWVSDDRAMFIAENEAETLCNSFDYVEAKKGNKTQKIWRAFVDKRTRDTHLDVNGAKIPIDDYFYVGRAKMLYPKDVTSEFSTGAECPEEVIGCRCQVIYV